MLGFATGAVISLLITALSFMLYLPQGPRLQRAFDIACIDVPRDQECTIVEIKVGGK